MVAAHSVVVLEMANHGFDGGATPHLAAYDLGDQPGAPCACGGIWKCKPRSIPGRRHGCPARRLHERPAPRKHRLERSRKKSRADRHACLASTICPRSQAVQFSSPLSSFPAFSKTAVIRTYMVLRRQQHEASRSKARAIAQVERPKIDEAHRVIDEEIAIRLFVVRGMSCQIQISNLRRN
jgi:hypothetical protein